MIHGVCEKRSGRSGEVGSIVKWSVLAHLKSQPRGQNFQAQT